MKLFCLRLKEAYCREKGKLNFSNFSQIGHTVFEILPSKDSVYFIVFANALIKLIRKLAKYAH